MNVNFTLREALVRCSPIPPLASVIGLHTQAYRLVLPPVCASFLSSSHTETFSRKLLTPPRRLHRLFRQETRWKIWSWTFLSGLLRLTYAPCCRFQLCFSQRKKLIRSLQGLPDFEVLFYKAKLDDIKKALKEKWGVSNGVSLSRFDRRW